MDYLEATTYLDYESPEIQKLIADFDSESLTDLEKAKSVYLKIRDGWRYNPYLIRVD